MDFPEDFFRGEIRESFYVEGMMKRAWAAQMEVLSAIDQVCRNNNLHYYADWGTLLGTVRHQGFIPWDDDMDICMLREDYERFWKVAKIELPEEYEVYNYNTVDDWHEMLTRVVNSSHIDFSEKRMCTFHGFPYQVGIDIFVLDYVPLNKEEEKMQIELVKMAYRAGNIVRFQKETHKINESQEELDNLIAQIQQLCGIQFGDKEPMERQLYILAEQLCKLYSSEEAVEVQSMCARVDGKEDMKFPKEWFFKECRLPFENFKMPVPFNSTEVLKKEYGDNFMTPVIGTADHEYPFYKKQQKRVLKELGYIPE